MMEWKPERPELDELLRKATNRKMTKAEIAEQRRSWVRGELMLSRPEMTLERANALINRVEADQP